MLVVIVVTVKIVVLDLVISKRPLNNFVFLDSKVLDFVN